MSTYKFTQFNVEIIDPIIVKDGYAGGQFLNNISQGSFSVDIKLITDSSSFGVRLESEDTQPTDFSIEAIDVWIDEQLVQYEL